MALKYMVLSALGPDRPGIVKEISSVIHKAGGNLEDSRMAILAGDFAVIVLFSASDAVVGIIKEKCRVLEEKLSLEIHLKETVKSEVDSTSKLFDFEATGVDQPGIVHAVSSILAEFDTNVVSLESRLSHAAFYGTAMFTVRAELQIRSDGIVDQLRKKLDRVCDELQLTYDFNPAPKR